jgi:hypothetical protein
MSGTYDAKKLKTMKYKFVSLALLLAATFFSCKKDDLLVPENSAVPVSLLSRVLVDNQPAFEYLYNGANFINEEKSRFDYTLHHYDGQNKLVSTDYYVNYDIISSDLQISATAMNRKEFVTPDNSNKGYTVNYEYNSDGKLIKTIYSRPLSTSSEYSDFSYDANNRISRQNLYWEDTKTGYIDYAYSTEGNLISEMLYYVPAVLGTTTLYEYDNKPNPYKYFSRLATPGIYTNVNNIVKETYTINLTVAQGIPEVQVTESTYAYNSNGYPISKNGNTKYIYK